MSTVAIVVVSLVQTIKERIAKKANVSSPVGKRIEENKMKNLPFCIYGKIYGEMLTSANIPLLQFFLTTAQLRRSLSHLSTSKAGPFPQSESSVYFSTGKRDHVG